MLQNDADLFFLDAGTPSYELVDGGTVPSTTVRHSSTLRTCAAQISNPGFVGVCAVGPESWVPMRAEAQELLRSVAPAPN